MKSLKNKQREEFFDYKINTNNKLNSNMINCILSMIMMGKWI